MNADGRKRIDISADAHALLESEARRRGAPMRELLDQAVKEMLDRGTRAALSVTQQRENRSADRIAGLYDKLDAITGRFDALLAHQTKSLPAALGQGFDAIKQTIRNTGGTGHLRDMINEFEIRFGDRFDKVQAAAAKARELAVLAIDERADKTERKIDWLVARQTGKRAYFRGGAITGFAALLLLAFAFRDTAPTRWLAVRMAGATTAGDASWNLVGDGRLGGLMLAETKALLKVESFRTRYTWCVEQAKASRTAVRCRLTFPPLHSR